MADAALSSAAAVVYGSIDEGHAKEDAALRPRSPYSAAKAAGEQLARSYHVTYGLDVVITRGSNTYGAFQHPDRIDERLPERANPRPDINETLWVPAPRRLKQVEKP